MFVHISVERLLSISFMCKDCKHPLFGRDLIALSYHVAETSKKQQPLTLGNYVVLVEE